MMVQSGEAGSMINTDMREAIESYAAKYPAHSTINKINRQRASYRIID
jgi:DNA polymerase-3 subunit delta'